MYKISSNGKTNIVVYLKYVLFNESVCTKDEIASNASNEFTKEKGSLKNKRRRFIRGKKRESQRLSFPCLWKV